MDTIVGIDIYPIISFLIFFIFFVVLFFWVARIKKSEIQSLSNLPLEENNSEDRNHKTSEAIDL